MSEPTSKFACVSNQWVRQMHFAKVGDANHGHTHAHDHLTLIAKGRFRVCVEGRPTEFSEGNIVFVQRGKSHYFVALQDDSVAYCIHALRTGEREEDILDPAMVPDGINPRFYARDL